MWFSIRGLHRRGGGQWPRCMSPLLDVSNDARQISAAGGSALRTRSGSDQRVLAGCAHINFGSFWTGGGLRGRRIQYAIWRLYVSNRSISRLVFWFSDEFLTSPSVWTPITSYCNSNGMSCSWFGCRSALPAAIAVATPPQSGGEPANARRNRQSSVALGTFSTRPVVWDPAATGNPAHRGQARRAVRVCLHERYGRNGLRFRVWHATG
jgi:hypothetical protein